MYSDHFYANYFQAQEPNRKVVSSSLLPVWLVQNNSQIEKQFRRRTLNEKYCPLKKKTKIFDKIHNRLLIGEHFSSRIERQEVVTCLSIKGDTEITIIKKIIRGGMAIMVKKPTIVLNCIKYMDGVDRANQYAELLISAKIS